MPWTPAQIHTLVMTHAHEGEALCPTCHVPLIARQEQLPRDSRPITVLGCPVCSTEVRLVVPTMEEFVAPMM